MVVRSGNNNNNNNCDGNNKNSDGNWGKNLEKYVMHWYTIQAVGAVERASPLKLCNIPVVFQSAVALL